MFILLLMITVLVRWSIAAGPSDNLDEYAVISNITKNYLKTLRPSVQTLINIKLSIKQINSLDEKNQVLVSNSYFSCYWMDSRLTWDPDAFGGTQEVLLPVSSIWMPDLFIINTAGTNGFVSLPSSQLASIGFNGDVYVVFYLSNQRTRCDLSLKHFPFDTQECSIKIGSWMLDTNKIGFYSDDGLKGQIDASDYVDHAVWDLVEIDFSTVNSSERFFGLKTNYTTSDASFDLTLKRRPLYFMINNIFPCLILNMVVLLLFILPFPIQIGSTMSIFMTFSVYSLRVSSDQAPQSKYLPMVTLYYMFGILYTFMAYIWFILANEFSTKEYLPVFLEKFAVKFIKRVLFWLFNEKPLWKSNKVKEIKNTVNDNMTVLKLKTDSNNSDKNIHQDNQKENPQSTLSNLPHLNLPHLKCGNCDICDKCKNNKEAEKIKKAKKTLNDANVKAWNFFMCFILFLIMLSCNLITWLLLSSPPSGF